MSFIKPLLTFVLFTFSTFYLKGINPPSPVSPNNGSIVPIVPLVDWSHVAGNVGYILEVDTSNTFNSNNLVSITTTSNYSSANVDGLNFGDTYYWRVATISPVDTSIWSSVRTFSTANTVSLASPSSNATTGVQVDLDWYHMAGNTGYLYELDTNSNFNSSTIIKGTSAANISQATVGGLSFNTKYFWRVAVVSLNDTSDWSQQRSFTTTSSPFLSTPNNNSNYYALRIFIDWSYVQGASGYLVQVDSSLLFNSNLLQTLNRTSSSTYSDVNFFGKKYYVRVAAYSQNDTSDWSNVRAFNTNPTINLISPALNSNVASVSTSLDWGTYTGNSGYVYQYDTSANFNSPLFQEKTSSQSSSNGIANNLRFGTTYYWRVAVISSVDTSQWSIVRHFKTNSTVSLVSPANNYNNSSTSRTLDWSTYQGNSGYEYEYDTTSSFNSPLLSTKISSSSSSNGIATGLLFGTTYYWRVRAFSAVDTSSWSVTRYFNVNPTVYLTSPSNGATNQNVSLTLDWSTFGSISSYICEVDTSSNFNSPLVLNKLISGNFSSTSINNLLFNQRYFWRVKAATVYDTSSWSIVRNFTTKPTVFLNNPTNGAGGLNSALTLDWSTLFGSTGYKVELDTSPNFNSILDTIYYTSSSSQQYIRDLYFGTTYYWRVAAFHSLDTSNYSSPRSFTIRDNVNLLSPSNNSVNNSVALTLRWSSSSGATNYIYQLDNVPTFNSTNLLTANSGTNARATINLLYGTKYYWRVAMVNNKDTSDWSSIRNFTTAFQITQAPNLVSPLDNAILNPVIQTLFDWDTLNNTNSYEIEIAIDPSFNNVIFQNSFSITQSFIGPFSSHSTYYWRVRGKNSLGNGLWSSVRTFTTQNCNTGNTLTLNKCGSYISPSGKYTWTSTGNYSDTIPNSVGCDSILTVQLFIDSSETVNLSASNCYSYTSPSGRYTWYSSGTYKDTLTKLSGCDSILNINLTINDSIVTTILDSICIGSSYSLPNGTIIHNVTNPILGKTISSTVNGCDSIIYLDIRINALPVVDAGADQAICLGDTLTLGGNPTGPLNASYLWNNSSSLNLNQVSNPISSPTITTNYTVVVTDQLGCTNTDDITVTVNSIDTTVSINGLLLTANQINAKYNWLDCNNNYLPINDTNRTFNAIVNGNYAVEIISNGCIDTSACIPIISVGVPIHQSNVFGFYPNPTSGKVCFSINNSHRFEVFNMRSKLVLEGVLTTSNNSIDLTEFSDGIYYLKVDIKDQTKVLKIVKQ